MKTYPAIYLAGHITRDDYRRTATEFLLERDFQVLDPFRPEHDLRGAEAGEEQTIVRWDLEDIVNCYAVLANFTDMSVGTSMECWFAHSIGRPVFAFVEDADMRISPWIQYIAQGGYAWRDLGNALESIAVHWYNDVHGRPFP